MKTPPDQHCFREDNCAEHPEHTGPACCCCGWLADSHTGCDCDCYYCCQPVGGCDCERPRS